MNRNLLYLTLAFCCCSCVYAQGMENFNNVPSVIQTNETCDVYSIDTKVNSVFKIELEANVTTGYSWFLGALPSEIEVVTEKYIAQQTNLSGAGGTSVFCFKTKAEGKYIIPLVYRRVWESDVPVRNVLIWVNCTE